jgi:hypothetical protein
VNNLLRFPLCWHVKTSVGRTLDTLFTNWFVFDRYVVDRFVADKLVTDRFLTDGFVADRFVADRIDL